MKNEDPHSSNSTAAQSPEEMSRVGLKAVFNLANAWQLTDRQTRELLGNQQEATYRRWRNGQHDVVSDETLLRISLLLSIYYGTHVLLPSDQADRWVTRPNTAFNGKPALRVMIDDGIEGTRSVSNHLAAYSQ